MTSNAFDICDSEQRQMYKFAWSYTVSQPLMLINQTEIEDAFATTCLILPDWLGNQS